MIEELYEASQAGKEMVNPSAWADKAHATAQVTTLLTVSLGLLGQFNVIPDGFALSGEDIKIVAVGIATVGTPIASFLHRASNRNAG